ncbi:uncharacterized protein LOC129098220 [Anoplopoma fimbria]|uniref:uncharacterized protein LOC129098220 n=1 Tax=Anoplopoma fimbria TaxID=229290 RepID=UPI0023EB6FB2|nr:uncharacterized protein LOC129098220 [Anoplopoma fimbria]
MKSLCFWVTVLLGLCFRSSLAFPPKDFRQHASFQSPQITGRSQHTQQLKNPAEEREQVNTVRLTCHPDSLEIIIKADMFGVGAPVDSHELRLGVEQNDYCRATPSSGDEYSIIVGLVDCGTKHWMTEDALIYTNLLIYSPVASPDGVVRMDEAVIPVECHYERKYSLSSSSIVPTWIPFMSTQAAVATLEFDLRIMTTDWLYRRSSNVYFLGEPISIEASVRVGNHVGLRVFVSSCVATLQPDIYSVPRYVFVENGCLVDSELPGSKSYFLSRTQDDTLQMNIDAFRFYNEDRGELYITCHLTAAPANDAEAPNKACTFLNGRWRSADGNDYLCGNCQRVNKPSSPGKIGPRGFGKPDESEPFWRSGLRANTVGEQEARVGPMVVLPASQKSGPIPFGDLPPVLNKISRPLVYGSQWRSGNNNRVDQKGLVLDSQSTPDEVTFQTLDSKQTKEVKSGTERKDGDVVAVFPLLEEASPELSWNSKGAALDKNNTAAHKKITMLIPVHSASLALLISFAFGVANAIRSLKDGPVIDAEGREYKSAKFITDEEDIGGQQLNDGPTVRVQCTEASMIIYVKPDVFKNGHLVSPEELFLGSAEHPDRSECRAVAAGDAEYVIEAVLQDCGSKLTISEDSVIYSNKLIISPAASFLGITRRMHGLVPVSCHYKRTHLVSSNAQQTLLASFTPAKISTAAFSLKLMTDDWRSETSSRSFYIGELLHLEASYTGPDSGQRRLFIDSCVATLSPDTTSVPRYSFIENHGCLSDAKYEGSNSLLLPRTSSSTLRLQLDVFLFHQEPRNSMYITCKLKATSEMWRSSSINKACNYVHSRWINVDGSDVCPCCDSTCSKSTPDHDTNLRPQTPEDVTYGTVTLGPLMVFPRK